MYLKIPCGDIFLPENAAIFNRVSRTKNGNLTAYFTNGVLRALDRKHLELRIEERDKMGLPIVEEMKALSEMMRLEL